MEKHTPIPWKWERPSRIMLDAGIQRYAIYRGTEVRPEWIGEIHFAKHDVINDGLDENKANVELIVKAVNAHANLVEACRAALRYDEAIKAAANDPDQMSSYCTAAGETLDTLYFDWQSKATECLKHLESNPLK